MRSRSFGSTPRPVSEIRINILSFFINPQLTVTDPVFVNLIALPTRLPMIRPSFTRSVRKRSRNGLVTKHSPSLSAIGSTRSRLQRDEFVQVELAVIDRNPSRIERGDIDHFGQEVD